MRLTYRTILITGGSAGIGLAFALKFLELGNEVIVTGRRQAVLDAVKAQHPKLHTIQSDIADPEQIAALAARVKAEFPKLDVLMNNAGVGGAMNLRSPVSDLAALTSEVDINLSGVIRMTSALSDIRPGQSNQLAFMRRLAPNFINRQLWKASRVLVPAPAAS